MTVSAPPITGVAAKSITTTWQIAAVTAVVGTLIFYLPVLHGLSLGRPHWFGFMLSHDQRVFYLPSFIEGYRRFWSGGITGIDFFTGGGASVFAYRPNMSPYYPPYILAYLLIDCSNIKKAAQAYLAINVAHHFVGMFFTVVFVRRFLGLSGGAAVLAASVFALSYQTSAYIVFATFYFQMLLVPLVACTLCWLALTRSWLACVWASPIFVTYALSNYGPTMLVGLALSIVAALVAGVTAPDLRLRRGRGLLRPVASLSLAVIVCAPYFYAQLAFKAVMAPTADDIDQVAHDLSLRGYDVLNGLSQFLDLRRTSTELALVWGAIPVFLCLAGLDVLLRGQAEARKRTLWVAGLSALVYVCVLIICFGTSFLAPADAFFYAAPVIGKMHIYHRYLIFGQFFFAIIVACLASLALQDGSIASRRFAAWAGIVIWLGVASAVLIWPPTVATFAVDQLLVEVFVVAMVGIAIAVARPSVAFVFIAMLAGAIGLYSAYTNPLAFNKAVGPSVEPDPRGPEMAAIIQFIKAHDGGKNLPKLVIASNQIQTYFSRNVTWTLSSKVKVMNFQGYPPHLSLLADYAARFAEYGRFDVGWLKETGADFVFWNESAPSFLGPLKAAGFEIGPVLELPFGNRLGKLSAPRDPARQPVLLDLAAAAAGSWPAAIQMEGWAVEQGRLVSTGTGQRRFGYAVAQTPGATYDVSFDVGGSARGRLTVAFGNRVIDELDLAGPRRYERRVTTTTVGDLWITAGQNFDGDVANIAVRRTPDTSAIAFDNGLLRVIGSGVSVRRASSDYSRRISLDLELAGPASVQYLLWPNPYMVPYLNGTRANWIDATAGLRAIAVPPGRHRVEIRFESRPGQLFAWLQVALWIAVFLALLLDVVPLRSLSRRVRRRLPRLSSAG